MKRRNDFDERQFSRPPETFEGTPMGDLGRLPAGSVPVATSEESAAKLTPSALHDRRMAVLAWFVSRGEHGGTADELEAAFGLGHNATSPRVTELVTLELLERTTVKRRTRQGSPAFVHVATASGRGRMRGAA